MQREEIDRLQKQKLSILWSQKLELVRNQEQEILRAETEPLRNYLLKNVIPTLSAGLTELAKVRPDDPIDFLAEYLCRQNPRLQK